MKEIQLKIKCKSCGGAGLYTGLGERDGAAVVCHQCKGSGCYDYRFQYEDFVGRVTKDGVIRVFEVNPGICIGTGNGLSLEDFGGISFGEWEAGKEFGPGTENRRFTCPAWWYQSADYTKKPNWPECSGCGSFSGCDHFNNKARCWDQWDAEFANLETSS